MDGNEVLPWSLEWWHLVGGLISISLSILGLAFKGWSGVLREIKEEWGQKFDVFASRQSQHEKKLEESMRILNVTHLQIIDRVARIEGILSMKLTPYHHQDREG